MSRAKKLMESFVPRSLSNATVADVGVDLGSYQTRVISVDDAQIAIVPSCMVLTSESGELVSIGQEAREVIGRNALGLEVASPIKESNFSDQKLSAQFLQHCFNQLHSREKDTALPNKAYFFVTPNITEVQYLALKKVSKEVGIAQVVCLQKPLLASLTVIGRAGQANTSGLQLLIDCGFESTYFCILQFGKVFYFHQVWWGGKELTEELQHFLKLKHQLEIGAQSAERLKHECATRLRDSRAPAKEILENKSQKPEKKNEYFVVTRGRDVITSLPKSIKLSVEEFRPLFEQFVSRIMDELSLLMGTFGPELVEELIAQGFYIFIGLHLRQP